MSSEDRADYCVYMHVDKQGVPFYIGSGTLRRAMQKELKNSKTNSSSRGMAYSQKVSELSFDYDVNVVCQNLTKSESIDLEILHYEENKSVIVNKNRPSHIVQINTEEVSLFVKYNPEFKTGLEWIVDIYARGGKGRINASRGTQAGSVMRNRHSTVKISGVSYLCHRVVAAIHNTDINGKIVDHIDGDLLNNKIENLRVTDHKINNRNCAIGSNNKSGKKGVHIGKVNISSYWKENGVHKTKSFSVNKYGYDEAFRLACEYRDSKIKELNEQGAGYTDRHCN